MDLDRENRVRKLQKQGISNDKIASITGHSSEQRFRGHAETDPSDYASMSKILSEHASSTSTRTAQKYGHLTTSSASVYTCCSGQSYLWPLLRISSLLIHSINLCRHPFLCHSMFLTAVLVQTPVHAHLQNAMPKMYNPKSDPVHLFLMTTLISSMTVIITSCCRGYPLECTMIIISYFTVLMPMHIFIIDTFVYANGR